MSSRLDRSAVVWGAVFIALGAGGLLHELGVWTLEPGYVLPALLVVAGLALTISALVIRSGPDRGA